MSNPAYCGKGAGWLTGRSDETGYTKGILGGKNSKQFKRRNICIDCSDKSVDCVIETAKLMDRTAKVLRKHRYGHGGWQVLIECKDAIMMEVIIRRIRSIPECHIW